MNNQIILTLGSREVEGFNSYQGTSFTINGTAHFIDSGEEFEKIKSEYPFINKILEITVSDVKQLI